MTITLEINGPEDDLLRVIRYGHRDLNDHLSIMDCDPELVGEQEFRTKVFDLLWQLAGGQYD